MNIVALVGHLSRPSEPRQLPSGDHFVAYEVSARSTPEAKTDTIPVVWFGAPAHAAHLDVGEQVLVVGRVRRRFFSQGGRTQSRTEVVADLVVPTTQARRARAALVKVLARLETMKGEEAAAASSRPAKAE